ncbi:MAG: hypothetical protein ACM3JK_04320 [Betaproteobacteria bacterium]
MVKIMDMNSANSDSDYTSEVMCAGWNPEIATMQIKAAELATQLIHYQSLRASGITPDVAALDVDAFLERMYASQR